MELASQYQEQLDQIVEQVQASDELAQYLDTEEEDHYQELKEKFEPSVLALYDTVADSDPLQLYALEDAILSNALEGLFLPRLLGYAVLRGARNQEYKYYHPQNRFKEILLSICNSANFDILKQRIGQSVQIGFALSSDIWITNLVNEIDNKLVKQFLNAQKISSYRVLKNRRAAYERFAKQFKTCNFYTSDFPKDSREMRLYFGTMHNFLEWRIQSGADHSSYIEDLLQVLENQDLFGNDNHLVLTLLVAHFVPLSDEHGERVKGIVNELRKDSNFSDQYFRFYNQLLKSNLLFTPESDIQFYQYLDHKIKDDIEAYFSAASELSLKGYMHQDVILQIRQLYNSHEGLSVINDSLRHMMLRRFEHIMSNLSVNEYPEYFELNKTFTTYIDLFDFQQFNQRLKEFSLKYVRKLLKRYTDKRGKDYQDIKKFVVSTFQDLGFMNEKQVKEIFKTKRKKAIAK